MATTLRMYATCQQLQAQAQAHAVAASGLLGPTELRLHMPPSIALATRGRLRGLRLQLALLDREFDDLGNNACTSDLEHFLAFWKSRNQILSWNDLKRLGVIWFFLVLADYETLRALDADDGPTTPSMTEEEINALPVHKYKVSEPQRSVMMISLLLFASAPFWLLSFWYTSLTPKSVHFFFLSSCYFIYGLWFMEMRRLSLVLISFQGITELYYQLVMIFQVASVPWFGLTHAGILLTTVFGVIIYM